MLVPLVNLSSLISPLTGVMIKVNGSFKIKIVSYPAISVNTKLPPSILSTVTVLPDCDVLPNNPNIFIFPLTLGKSIFPTNVMVILPLIIIVEGPTNVKFPPLPMFVIDRLRNKLSIIVAFRI